MALKRNSAGALLRIAPMTLATGGGSVPPVYYLTRYYLVKWRTKIFAGETLISDVESEFEFRIQEDDTYEWLWYLVYEFLIKEEYWPTDGTYVNANVFLFVLWDGTFFLSYSDGFYGLAEPIDPPPAVFFEPFASEIYETPGPDHKRYEYHPVSSELVFEQLEQ